MWPLGTGQIQTCSQAGGMTSSLHRSVSSAASRPELIEVDEAACRPVGGSSRDPLARPSAVAAQGQFYPLAPFSVSDMAGELRIEPIKARHLADLDLLFAHGDPRSCQCDRS